MEILDQQHIPKIIGYRRIVILDFYDLNVSVLSHNNSVL